MSREEKTTVEMPEEMASAVNLMAHPLAGAAALSALGFGLASQALGLWMGTIAGAAEASGRLLKTAAEPGARASSQTAAKVRARARSVMEQAQSVAREAAAAEAPARGPADGAKRAEASSPVSRMGRPPALERPQAPDDLKAIPGIGPKLEQVLNGLGIWTHAQIAAWTPAEIAWVEDRLGFGGRIGRDGWVDRAAALAGSGAGH